MIRPLAILLALVVPLANLPGSLAQDGPLLPGLEPAASEQESLAAEEPLENPPVSESPTSAITPQREVTDSGSVALPSLADDGITPLDADGHPITSPEQQQMLDLPAPPPVPRPSARARDTEPLLPIPNQDDREEPKKNFWQKSTDALRNLTRPEPKPTTRQQPPAKRKQVSDDEALRNWQMRRQLPPVKNQPLQPMGKTPTSRLQNNSAAAGQAHPQSGARQVQPQARQPQFAPQSAYGSQNYPPSSRRVNPGAAGSRTQPQFRPQSTPAARKPATSAKVEPNQPRAPWEQDGPRQTARPGGNRTR